MSTLKVNDIIEATSGGGKVFFSRAWVNFNGVSTVSIRDDGNVSSISDGGTGLYTMNFSSNFSSVNYCLLGTANVNRSDDKMGVLGPVNPNRDATPFATSNVKLILSEVGYRTDGPFISASCIE